MSRPPNISEQLSTHSLYLQGGTDSECSQERAGWGEQGERAGDREVERPAETHGKTGRGKDRHIHPFSDRDSKEDWGRGKKERPKRQTERQRGSGRDSMVKKKRQRQRWAVRKRDKQTERLEREPRRQETGMMGGAGRRAGGDPRPTPAPCWRSSGGELSPPPPRAVLDTQPPLRLFSLGKGFRNPSQPPSQPQRPG